MRELALLTGVDLRVEEDVFDLECPGLPAGLEDTLELTLGPGCSLVVLGPHDLDEQTLQKKAF